MPAHPAPAHPRRRTRFLLPGLALLILSSTGCGWLFVQGPPAVAPANTAYIPCTDSKALAHLDIAMAGLQVVNMLVVASMSDQDYFDAFEDTPKGTIYGIQAGFGTLWALSARSGYAKVDACRTARMAAASNGAALEDAPPIPYPLLTPESAATEVTEPAAQDADVWHPPMRPSMAWPTARPAGSGSSK